ncbi:hypothetical protein HDU76_013791 [Blyttiomyces sp. JEL0837]|nr:hypothetical protein HDU76_013791 [Blyttiomyces sp. JEL0837]
MVLQSPDCQLVINAFPSVNFDAFNCCNTQSDDRTFMIRCDQDNYITKLDLKWQKIHGTIPDSIANLSQLEYLDLSSNFLTGGIPDNVFNLQNLQTLHVGENNLSGGIPDRIGDLKQLEYLGLASNSFQGPVPSSFNNLPNLKVVDLANNYLTGSLPEMSSLKTRIYLFTSLGPQWADCSPASIQEGTDCQIILQTFPSHFYPSRDCCSRTDMLQCDENGRVTKINIQKQLFNGYYYNLPPSFAKLTELRHLDSSFCAVSQMKSLSDVTGLEYLRLRNCNVMNVPPDVFQKLVNLVYASIGSLTNLVWLVLERTKFEGTLPQQMAKLTKLKTLDVSQNFLHGSIPPKLGSLPNLVKLDVSKNAFNGTVPLPMDKLQYL